MRRGGGSWKAILGNVGPNGNEIGEHHDCATDDGADGPVHSGHRFGLHRAAIRLRDRHPQPPVAGDRRAPSGPRPVPRGAPSRSTSSMRTPADAGASSVCSHFFPGPPQYVGPNNAVIQRVEPTAPIPLGRKVQSALEVS